MQCRRYGKEREYGPRSYFVQFKISYLKTINTCNHKTNDTKVSKIDYNISAKLFAIN